jgi:adenylate kinase family enzyme
MSSYVNFYLKNGKTGAITYLFGYSRSSAIYQIFDEELYVHQTKEGYCDELTVADCERLIRESLNQRDKLHQVIASYEKSIKDLATWNNSVEEKMEYYSDWDGCINQAKEDIEMYDHACSFFSILKEMIDYNPDKAILLAGIDCYASREEEEADK